MKQDSSTNNVLATIINCSGPFDPATRSFKVQVLCKTGVNTVEFKYCSEDEFFEKAVFFRTEEVATKLANTLMKLDPALDLLVISRPDEEEVATA